MHVGLRPGELHGLRNHNIDRASHLINVRGVATRSGYREYPKTTRSNRAVPIPHHVRLSLYAHLDQMEDGDLVFPGPHGEVWDDRDFRTKVFQPAVAASGVRRGTPYDMRHTAASWLVQRGVQLQRVQELLGHEKYTTTLRYAHLQPQRYEEVLEAWGQ
jgi:site-specific recombinase XerD